MLVNKIDLLLSLNQVFYQVCALAISDVLFSNFDFAAYEYYADAQWNKVPPDDHVLCDRNLVDTGIWAMQSLMAMYIKVQKYV